MGRRRNGTRVQQLRTSCSCARSAGSRLQVLDTMEGVLGLLPVLLSPAGRRRVLWLAGQFRFTIREERDDGQHIGRFRIPTRVCLRVTTRTSEVDTVLVKAPQGPKRSAESPHPRRAKAPVSEVRPLVFG